MTGRRAVAINIGANTNDPGFRGPVWPDGRFEYVPIPETEPTSQPVPTYGELAAHLEYPIPDKVHETPVHLDPEFPEYPFCERYTYGDPYGIKASPLLDLSAGDHVFFYATLSVVTDGRSGEPDWLPPDWGAFVIGHFQLDSAPRSGAEYTRTVADEGQGTGHAAGGHAVNPFRNNAHHKRQEFDAKVLLLGDPEGSRLYEYVVPLSGQERGTDPGALVTEWSEDSGRGPWWRRPLRFDADGTERLLQARTEPPN